MNTLDIPISELTDNTVLEIRVTGQRTFKARLWLAGVMFRIGGWISGMDIEISAEAKR